METIPRGDCKEIGFVRKTHGVHGKIVFEFEEKFELTVEDTDLFFIELDGLLVPFFVSENGMRITSSKSAIVELDYVDTEKYAKRLVGQAVFLYNDDIVEESFENEETPFENFLLIDSLAGDVGIISEINDYAGNIVFTVKSKNKEILIPFNDDLLVSIDEEKRTITLNLPKGLIE